MKYIFCFYLLAGSVWDIRTKKLPSLYIWAGCVGMGAYAFYQLICLRRTLGDLLISLLPGILVYLFAKVCQTIGEGDAWIIFIMGMVLSFFDLSKVLMLAFFLSAAGSIFILLIRQRIENMKIPFVPYLFLATGMVLWG